jgi:hypothetical protein
MYSPRENSTTALPQSPEGHRFRVLPETIGVHEESESYKAATPNGS